jgi:hypothetical protein
MGGAVTDSLEALNTDSDDLRPITRLNDCSFAHYRRLISAHWNDDLLPRSFVP